MQGQTDKKKLMGACLQRFDLNMQQKDRLCGLVQCSTTFFYPRHTMTQHGTPKCYSPQKRMISDN
jgi:hypothetical protein